MRKYWTPADAIVPPQHPRIVLETAVLQGADRNAVLAGTELTPGFFDMPDARLSFTQYRRLILNALELTGNPALGMDVGRATQTPQMGMLGMLLQSSGTVREALGASILYYKSIAPFWEPAIDVVDDVAELSFRALMPFGRVLPFATEVVLVAYDVQARQLLHGPVPVRRLFVEYPAPSYAARFGEFYDVPVEYESSKTAVQFDASVLDTPISSPDPATAAFAARYCAEQVASLPGGGGAVNRVRALLGSAEGAPPDLERLARSLQTSERSLRRSLAEAGTSYTELLDEVRKERALVWAEDTKLSFDTIASRLGFANPGSFRRAFKRWTGETPAQVRAKKKSG